MFGGRGTLNNPGIGHFYNVMNQGGSVVQLDGQVRQVVDYGKSFDWYALLRTN